MSTTHLFINDDSREMSLVSNESVQLIVTSPPYWQLEDHGSDKQIGFNDSYEEYINDLNLVWNECFRVLEPGCCLHINVGDRFTRSVYYSRYRVIPIHSEIIRFCEEVGFDYMGSVVWQKPMSMHTTGGEKIMGSFSYPREGIVKIDFKHILLFKKIGKATPISREKKEASKFTIEEWNEYSSSHWTFGGARQDKHIAVFPEELPKRLVRMFSFVGDTVLDPFMDSGTTTSVAGNLNRNSIGYEINKNSLQFYKEKVVLSNGSDDTVFDVKEDHSTIDFRCALDNLPYRFADVHKLDKLIDVKQNIYGNKFEMDKSMLTNENDLFAPNADKEVKDAEGPMVMVNHVRRELRQLMTEKGICYLRAGNTKGSVLVRAGLERLQYVLLHTTGYEPQLFKLKTKGMFQVWTKETLIENGLSPQSSSCYVVFHFDNQHPLLMNKVPELKENKNTCRAKVKKLSEFVE